MKLILPIAIWIYLKLFIGCPGKNTYILINVYSVIIQELIFWWTSHFPLKH